MQLSGEDAKCSIDVLCTKDSQRNVCLKLLQCEDELSCRSSVASADFTPDSWHACFILCMSRLQSGTRTSMPGSGFRGFSAVHPGRFQDDTSNNVTHAFNLSLYCFTTHSLNYWHQRRTKIERKWLYSSKNNATKPYGGVVLLLHAFFMSSIDECQPFRFTARRF